MKSKGLMVLAVVLFIVLIVGFVVLFAVPGPKGSSVGPAQNLSSDSNESGEGSAAASSTIFTQAILDDTISVEAPLKNSHISSPLVIRGKARGSWYFEASAPVELRNASGAVIAQGHITAQGDWMTSDYVPFTATLTFTAQPTGSTGTLILKNDNPSGDPSREKELDIPLNF